MVKRLIIAVVLLALIAGGLVGFNLFRDNMIAQIFANLPVPPATVSTVEARPVDWQPKIEAIGTVNASQGVDLTVETAGVVKEILFSSNQQVTAGALLLRLDDQVQQADLEAARTQLALDRTNLVRARELKTRGVATNVSLDSSEAAASASEAQVARATALVEQRELSAPFSGTIGLPRVDLGQYVAPGTIVTTLQDLETMRVDFNLPEQQLPNLRIGQPLDVRIEGLDQAFRGQLIGIDPRVDAASRLVALRGTIANAGGKLTPGQFVRIRVDLPAESGVIALPQTTLVTSLYGDYVYVVRPKEGQDDQLEVRQVFVTPGRRSGGLVELVSGVTPGDIVVTAGQNRLSNGMPAVIDNSINPAVAVAAQMPAETPAQGTAETVTK
ncbi:MAG TPA: efflux RND transporter periplasmic adaptor subunit [Paracoccaceae bacterium]